MKKVLLIASLFATAACTTIPDSVVNRAFQVAIAAERGAALVRCPKEGKEREIFLVARSVFNATIWPHLSPERQTELKALRDSADDRCGFTSAEMEAAVMAAED